MAHFYGSVVGQRGEATRLGSRHGLRTIAASWQGAVRTQLYVNDQGEDCALVTLMPWQGRGVSRTIYDGPVNGGGDVDET